MRKGICCAGNILVDIVYPIEAWPRQSELTHITEGIRQAAGICLREEDGTLHPESMKAALQQLKDLGRHSLSGAGLRAG